jgi:hypothetical protein
MLLAMTIDTISSNCLSDLGIVTDRANHQAALHALRDPLGRSPTTLREPAGWIACGAT